MNTTALTASNVRLTALARDMERLDPGFQLNRELGLLLGWTQFENRPEWWTTPDGKGYALLPRWSDSFDAVARLHAARADRWKINGISESADGLMCVPLTRRHDVNEPTVVGQASDLPRAYCAAVLRAIAADEVRDADR